MKLQLQLQLQLKHIHPTEKTFGHTKIYHNKQYLGYIVQGKLTKNWYFTSSSRIPSLEAITRKALLIKLTKILEEEI